MREHMGLYRGRLLHSGDWVEGNLVLDGYTWDCAIWEPGIKLLTEVDPDTVGECTGLRDKNGKLIFEGDIINGYTLNGVGDFRNEVVHWSSLFSGWYGRECRSLYNGLGDIYEIIGNIHDNPELLKGGEQ